MTSPGQVMRTKHSEYGILVIGGNLTFTIRLKYSGSFHLKNQSKVSKYVRHK